MCHIAQTDRTARLSKYDGLCRSDSLIALRDAQRADVAVPRLERERDAVAGRLQRDDAEPGGQLDARLVGKVLSFGR